MARRKMTKAASACVSREIESHCRAKRGKCKIKKVRNQVVAMSFSICKREGYRIPKPPRKRKK